MNHTVPAGVLQTIEDPLGNTLATAQTFDLDLGRNTQINNVHDDGEKRIEVEVSLRVYLNAFRVNGWGDHVTLNAFGG